MEREIIIIESDEEVIDVSDDEMNVEVITISDDEEMVDDEEEYDPVYDREVNIVLDDIEDMDFEPDINVEEEEAEEHQPLVDAGYESDSRVIESSRERILDNVEIVSLNDNTSVCVFYSYVVSWGVKMCISCFMRNRERFAAITIIERHETMRYRDVPHHYCIDCQERLFAIFLANICPMCQSRAAESED